jgi:hypothetical protein
MSNKDSLIKQGFREDELIALHYALNPDDISINYSYTDPKQVDILTQLRHGTYGAVDVKVQQAYDRWIYNLKNQRRQEKYEKWRYTIGIVVVVAIIVLIIYLGRGETPYT